MLFFKPSNRKEIPVLVVDIASASVGAVLAKISKNFPPRILATARALVHFNKNRDDARRIWKQAETKIDSVIKKVLNGNETPEYVFCIFSSPWYVAQTRLAKIKRDENFVVDAKLITSLIENEAENFSGRWQKKSTRGEECCFFLEKVPVKTFLNGYCITEPLGKKAHLFELFSYMSLGVGFVEDKLSDKFASDLKISQKIHLHSFPFMVFNVLENILNMQDGFIFVDTTGDITDVFIFRDNIIEEISSFPVGENFFVHRVASAFNLTPIDARGIIVQFLRGELDKAYTEKTKKILELAMGEWIDKLKNLLMDIAKEKSLPEKIYFCGNMVFVAKNWEKYFREFSGLTIFNKPLVPEIFTSGSIKHYFDFPTGFSSNSDIFLLLSVLFADKMLGGGHRVIKKQ